MMMSGKDFLTQRNARVFTKQKSAVYSFTQQKMLQRLTRLGGSCGAPQANRNDFYFSATQPIGAYAQPVAPAVRNGAVHCVKQVRKPLRRCGMHCGCGSYVALRCITECWKTRMRRGPHSIHHHRSFHKRFFLASKMTINLIRSKLLINNESSLFNKYNGPKSISAKY